MRTRSTFPTIGLSVLCAAVLGACGGGGGSGADTGPATSTDTATGYSANATQISDAATEALDTSVQTAQAIIATQAGAAAVGSRASAQSATAAGVTNASVNCLGGGTATLTISGGTPTSVTNGKLDTGEVYQLVYAACRGAVGLAEVNGTLTMTVQSATATDLSLMLATSDLTVTLPRGTVKVVGSTSHSLSSSTDVSGATVLTSQFSTPSLSVATHFNARQSTFTLSAVNITRQSTWSNGLPLSSSLNGTHTLSATLPNGAFSYTVSTQGAVNYSATGLPTSGAWTITLPQSIVAISVANAQATITVDDGKDGTIDRTFTIPVRTLQTDAG